MTTMASQITSLTVVYSTVYSDADQRKHQSSGSLAFVWGLHRDRWIPRTKGQLRGKCLYLMTSSSPIFNLKEYTDRFRYYVIYQRRSLLSKMLWTRSCSQTQTANFMGPACGPPGSCRPQMGPMLALGTLLSGKCDVSVVSSTSDTCSILVIAVLHPWYPVLSVIFLFVFLSHQFARIPNMIYMHIYIYMCVCVCVWVCVWS